MKHRLIKPLMSALACLLLASCASMPAPTRIARATAQLQADVQHLHVPRAGLLTGGKPAADAWRDLRAAGVTRVINLRPASELGSRNEADEVEASGMDYVQIAAAQAGGMSPQAVLEFGQSAGLTKLEPVVRERLGLSLQTIK